jgi:pimeloyl-ACP methyl ester carboxylesterase
MKTLVITLLAALVGYVVIGHLLIATDRPVALTTHEETVDFDSLLNIDYDALPTLHPYTTRDGATLHYRAYPSSKPSDTALILLHGSGWHSMQFHELAQSLAATGAAHVIAPDLRGHGFDPKRRGDVDYIGQLEDDVADLIAHVEATVAVEKIVLGGHSSGGGLVIRFAGGEHGDSADSYLLLAPFIHHSAPTTRPNSGGWAHPSVRRIIGLTMLNQLGITWLNDQTVIQFAMPQAVLDSSLGESATTAYSYRLNTAFAPRADYAQDLAALRQPFLLLVGADDEAFVATAYEPTLSKHTAAGSYVILPDTGHIDLLTHATVAPRIAAWLNETR